MNGSRYDLRGRKYERGQATYLVIRASYLLLLFGCSNAFGQVYPNGFYFTIPCSQFVQKPMTVFLADKKDEQVCITNQPVVTLEALESIGELQEIPENNYVSFEFKLTQETTRKLYNVITNLTDDRFAFVIGNEVIFVFEVDETKFNQLISVAGSLRAGKVQAIHQRLLDLFAKEGNN